MTLLAETSVRSDGRMIRRSGLVVCGVVLLAFLAPIPAGMGSDEFFTAGKIVSGTLVSPGEDTATGANQDVYAQRVVAFFRKQSGRFLPP